MKTGNLIIIGSSCLTPHVVLKDSHHYLTKYESNLFYELAKYSKVYTAQNQHFKIQILNLWMNWEKLCPNLSLTIENKMGNSRKKRWSDFELNINDWDIPLPKTLRIYQWIGKKSFHWGKWNDSTGNSAHTKKETQNGWPNSSEDIFF